jgi:hypothetical protein
VNFVQIMLAGVMEIVNGVGENVNQKVCTGGPPLVRFLLVRISNYYGFLKPQNRTIFLISTVFFNILEKDSGFFF